MTNKLQIAFSPTTDMWSFQVFRDLIKEIVLDVEGSDIFIITTNTDQALIDEIVLETGLNIDNIFIVANNTALITKLQTLNISIFLTDDIELQKQVNTQNPIQLIKHNISGTEAIFTSTTNMDVNKLQLKYFTYLKFWTDQIKKYK